MFAELVEMQAIVSQRKELLREGSEFKPFAEISLAKREVQEHQALNIYYLPQLLHCSLSDESNETEFLDNS